MSQINKDPETGEEAIGEDHKWKTYEATTGTI